MISHKVEILYLFQGWQVYSLLHKYLDSDTIFTFLPQHRTTVDLNKARIWETDV